MKPSLIKGALVAAISARRPVFLWGSPGVGKSQVVAQVAAEQELDLIDVRAVLLDPVDLRGLPSINGDGQAHWCIPSFLPKEGKGLFFLDELNAAPPLVQAACYQLVLDRKVGEYTMPDGWHIIAAGNRETDRAVTSRMATPLSNRFIHINFEVDLNDWITWAIENDILVEVMAFLRFRPELLNKFEPETQEKAFPTPRTWQFVSDLMTVNTLSGQAEMEVLEGTVGKAAAAEFMGFLKIYRDLPDIDGILLDPEGSAVPSDNPAALYAIVGALARKASQTNFDRVLKYGARLPVEFGVVLVRDSVKITADVQKTKAFIDWADKNQDVLI